MKFPLPKLTLLLLLFCGLFTVSCSSDDDDDTSTPALSNQFEYDTKRYDLKTGVYADLDLSDMFGMEVSSHSSRVFILADADLLSSSATFSTELVLALFSPGTSFTTGTFQYASIDNIVQLAAQQNKYFFTQSGLLIDLNADGDSDDEGEELAITGGTIKVSGTQPNYTVECDLTLENGKSLKVQYSGAFIDVTSYLNPSNLRKRESNISTYSTLLQKLLQK